MLFCGNWGEFLITVIRSSDIACRYGGRRIYAAAARLAARSDASTSRAGAIGGEAIKSTKSPRSPGNGDFIFGNRQFSPTWQHG